MEISAKKLKNCLSPEILSSGRQVGRMIQQVGPSPGTFDIWYDVLKAARHCPTMN
jgi:hypothetical protein